MTITYDPKYNDLSNSMDSGEDVRLPFAHFTANIINGNPEKTELKKTGDARYFGGWKFTVEKNEREITDANKLPSGWALADVWSKDNGEAYQCYLIRSLYVAPVARRSNWFVNKKSGKKRSSVQVLCLMGNRTDAGVVACGTVVLSAGSHAGVALDKTFSRFADATQKQRQDLGGILPHFFWRKIGCLGDDIQQRERGKSEKSPITPVYLFGDDPDNKTQIEKIAAVYTTAVLEKTFVGQSNMDAMSTLYAQARTWLDEWKRKENKTPNVADIVSRADPDTGEIQDF